jgi:transposase
MIAVCRLRYCARTRAYAERRTAEGKTKPEIIRCLKRYIARETYHALRADLADLTDLHAPTPRPRHALAITCGAGFIGRTRRKIEPVP